ncbi:MAG: MBL fold metallo-hydrolase [Candidatus Izemoplasmatales bacterium]|nr:MBL fold metallo-hydrolase [Candidatus Izemoplasmatales bacterium]
MENNIIVTRLSTSSWFKLVWNDLVIHFDPGYAGFFENQNTPLDELKQEADYIFISHPHKDHLREEVIKMIAANNTRIVCPKACSNSVFGSVEIVKPNSVLVFPKIEIEVVDAYNTPEGRSERKYHHKGDFVGFIITIGNRRIYFAGDTDFIPEMRDFGHIDIAFLPIGGTYVMDHLEALEATLTIKPDILFPMHQAMTDMAAFEKLVEAKTNVNVINLFVGEKAIV